MSITDELREWAHGFNGPWKAHEQAINAIADRIDEAHERTKRNLTDALHKQEDATRALDEESVLLPRDKDGEVWHVGDFVVGEVNPSNPKAIERLIWYGQDSGWQLETDTIIYSCPDRPRHYHRPTVEDVLREFALQIGQSATDDDIAAEYADRIREVVEHERD